MKTLWLLSLVALCGCVADQRNAKTSKQELTIWPEASAPVKHPGPVFTPPESISLNDLQQSQSGLVNAAVGKFTETFKPEIAAIRGDVTGLKGDITGIKADVKAEISNRLDVEFKAQNTATVKALSDLKFELNQKVDAALKIGIDNQQAFNQQISKMEQETKAGRDAIITNNQMQVEVQKVLERSFQSQIDTVKEFCWMFVSMNAAFFLYLRLRETLANKREMQRDELESKEDLALIGRRPKKFGE